MPATATIPDNEDFCFISYGRWEHALLSLFQLMSFEVIIFIMIIWEPLQNAPQP